ncbi:hypothetical protein [Streptomyces sp. T028]|uniref:hypothetical protein n=1 Tax=Streptomyces sp. T028 TaxID=3394379 RepID=UPI003A87C1A1
MTTPARTLTQAAELVRAFNHDTISTGADWQFPPHAYDAIGNLAYLARMLPQAIVQTLQPVRTTHEQGRVTIDGGGDPAKAVEHLRTAVAHAAEAAQLLADALDHAHAAVSPMGLDTRGLPGFGDEG